MKIKIHDGESGKNIVLFLPTWAMKWKLIWKYSKNEKYYPFICAIYKELREYIRKNGHFSLIEIDDHTGDRFYISV